MSLALEQQLIDARRARLERVAAQIAAGITAAQFNIGQLTIDPDAFHDMRKLTAIADAAVAIAVEVVDMVDHQYPFPASGG